MCSKILAALRTTAGGVLVANNAQAFAALQAEIDRLQNFPKAFIAEAAPKVAQALDTDLRAHIAAGQAPDGTPWPKTAEGAMALRGAGKALTVRVLGTRILAKLTGPEALHDRGQVRGKVRRQILPSSRLPDGITRAIRQINDQAFKKVMAP